jgi:hypothetical protein
MQQVHEPKNPRICQVHSFDRLLREPLFARSDQSLFDGAEKIFVTETSGDRTFIPFRNNAATEAIENAEMWISVEIVRRPTDCNCFKIPAPDAPASESRSKTGVFADRK